jgi:predicted nucleic-acid-binding protein
VIGLDTNILVRYIVRDDEAQTELATHLIETKCTREQPGFIALLVLIELVWVLSRPLSIPG